MTSELSIQEGYVRALPWEGVVALQQVLRYTLPAYGTDSWPTAIEQMRAAPSEEQIICRLMEELQSDPDQLFQEPIRVYFTEVDEWGEEDQLEYGDRPILPRVGNGMHRVAAAVGAGANWVRLTSNDGDLMSPSYGGQLVEVHYWLSGIPAASAGLADDEDLFDFAFGWLRSFRLTEQVWTETDTQGSCNGLIHAIYYCPHALEADLLAALRHRAGDHGLNLMVVASRGTTWEEIEADEDDKWSDQAITRFSSLMREAGSEKGKPS